MPEAPNAIPLRYIIIGPALIGLLLFTWAIFHSDLSRREGRESVPIAKMFHGENLALGKAQDGTLRTKPPLFYWAGLLISKAFGEVNEITLRLPSVFAGVATIILTTLFGARLFTPATGLFAGLILATSWRYAYLASHARVDMVFAFFITAAFIALWKTVSTEDLKERNRATTVAAVAIGFALLAKGPLGLVFPLMALLIYCRLTENKNIAWGKLIGISFAIILIWVGLAFLGGGEEFRTMVYNETLGRMSSKSKVAIHPNPFYYYIPEIFAGLAPWSLFLPVALWGALKSRTPANRPRFFLAVPIVALLVFLSLFPGKRGDYLLPLFPMASILVAQYFSQPSSALFPKGLVIPGRIVAGLILIVMTAFLIPIVLPGLEPDKHLSFMNSRDRWMTELLIENNIPRPLYLWAGAFTMLLLAGLVLGALRKKSRTGLFIGTCAWSVCILALVHGPAAESVSQYTSFKPFAQQAKKIIGNHPVYFFGHPREDLFFYLDRPVKETSHQETTEALKAYPNSFLLTRKSQSNDFLKNIPGLEIALETKYSYPPYRLIAHKKPETSDPSR